MRALVCHSFGAPESLVMEEVPEPEPGPGQLVMQVHAAAVTFPDSLILQNSYQFRPALPYVPGGGAAGEVVAVGPDVTGWDVGDRVMTGIEMTGAFAERMLVDAATPRRVPSGVPFDVAAGLNYAYGTALYGLLHRGAVQPGETVLVTGAGGAVGLSAIEVGTLLGARVIACASSDEKLDLCRRQGAVETINYTTEDLKARAKELTDGMGVDVVFDCVGGPSAEQALRSIAWNGRFLVIGFAAGIPSIPLNLALLKSCQIVGVFYGAMVEREPAVNADITDRLIDWVASGKLTPHIGERYPLERAPEALRALIDRTAVGKMVVTPAIPS